MLIEISLLIPADTSFCERLFSLMNGLHTKSRNRLLPEMVDHLMAICMLGPDNISDLERYIPKIIQRWHSNCKTKRRVSMMFREQKIPLIIAECDKELEKILGDESTAKENLI